MLPVPRPSLFALPLSTTAASKKNIKLHGYVTEVRSQTSFDIDDYRITRDNTLTLEFEKEDDSDLELPECIRVGAEVEIKGEFDPDSRELTARSIKLFPGEFKKVKRTALIEAVPQLENRGPYWEGSFRVDGQTLLVDERTKVAIVPNKSQGSSITTVVRNSRTACAVGYYLSPFGLPILCAPSASSAVSAVNLCRAKFPTQWTPPGGPDALR